MPSTPRLVVQGACVTCAGGGGGGLTLGERRGGAGQNSAQVPKLAGSDFPRRKLRFFPRWSLWCGRGGGRRSRGGGSSYGSRPFQCNAGGGTVMRTGEYVACVHKGHVRT